MHAPSSGTRLYSTVVGPRIKKVRVPPKGNETWPLTFKKVLLADISHPHTSPLPMITRRAAAAGLATALTGLPRAG